MDELWVRRRGPSAVVGWRRGERAWRILLVGSGTVGIPDAEPLLADARPGAGTADVVWGDAGAGVVDRVAVGAGERWVWGSLPDGGSRSDNDRHPDASPDVDTWEFGTAGGEAGNPGVERRPARFATPALGRAVITVLGPDRAGDSRPLLASSARDESGAMSQPVGFHERWIWSNQRLRAVLAAEVDEAAKSGRPVRPQPPLKGLGELVVTARSEAMAARSAAMSEVARLTQPVVVVETGVGIVVIGGALPEDGWRRLARGPQSPLLARADLVVASGPAGDDGTWPPAPVLAVARHLAAAVQVGVDDPPWLAPSANARLVAEVAVAEGSVTEVRLTAAT